MTSFSMRARVVTAAAAAAAAVFILLGAAGPTTAPVHILASGLGRPASLAVAGDGSVVFSGALAPAGHGYGVARFNLATGSLRLLDSGGPEAGSVAVDLTGAVYWTSPSQRAIFKLSRGSARPRRVIGGLDHPMGVAVDGLGRIYYSEIPAPGSDAAANTIWMFDGERTSVLATGQETPADLVAGASGDLYWTARSAGLIMHRAPDGHIGVLKAGLDAPLGIALDEPNRRLYFTELPTPGLTGDEGGRNALSELDLGTGRVTLLRRGDPDPLDVAIGPDGSVLLATGSATSIVKILKHGRKNKEAEVEASDNRPEDFFEASLTGDQEVPPVTTDASGWARLDLKSATKGSGGGESMAHSMSGHGSRPRLQVHVTMQEIGNVSAAELDLGMAGETGPMVALLLPAVQAVPGNDHQVEAVVTPDSLVGPMVGSWEAFEEALWGGGIYLNISTAEYPEGEIRGQVLPQGGTASNSPPDGTIVDPSSDVSLALGDPVAFAGTASDPDGDMISVLWDFGDGSTSSDLVPGDHLYAAAGSYVVTFTATDANGQSDATPDSRTIMVAAGGNSPPDGTITAPAADVTVKPGHSVSFAGEASDPDGDAVTVLWDFGDGATSTQPSPADHKFKSPGVYVVSFTATDAYGLADATPDSRTVTVSGGGGHIAQR